MDSPPRPSADQMSLTVLAANPTPTRTSVVAHPPYTEMITAAIATLKERNGSSKKAIDKYIDSHYSNLPTTHSALLNYHLKRLKDSGQILMARYSYKLPKSVPESTKKRPGRPLKADSVQVAVPVFDRRPSDALVVVPEPLEMQNGAVIGSIRGRGRGRGRPPKSDNAKLGTSPISRTSRGRPKKIAPTPGARVKRLGRSRGRPRLVNNTEGGVIAGADGALALENVEFLRIGEKRRGRPPKEHIDAKKPRILDADPVGSPRKDSSAIGTETTDNRLLVAYLELKGKLDEIQTRIKQTTSIIKPFLTDVTAVAALEELETLASPIICLSIVESHQSQSQEPETQITSEANRNVES